MKTREASVLEALRRAKDFLDSNSELLEAVNNSSVRRNLEEVAAELATQAITQAKKSSAGARETARQRRLCHALRFIHMRPIAAVARHSLRDDVPEFKALTLPRASLGAEPHVVAARAMAVAAKGHADVLIENGLQQDFIEQLTAAATQLERSIHERNVLWSERTGSTACLAAQQSRGRMILRILDSAVQSQLGDNAVLLSRWKESIRVRGSRSHVAAAPRIDVRTTRRPRHRKPTTDSRARRTIPGAPGMIRGVRRPAAL